MRNNLDQIFNAGSYNSEELLGKISNAGIAKLQLIERDKITLFGYIKSEV